MATYRVGIGSFNLKDGAVGLGTEASGLGNLKVEGTYKTTDLDVIGVSTFQRYAGFVADDVNIVRDTSLSSEHSTIGDIVVGLNSTFTVSAGATITIGAVESVSIGTHFSPPVGGVEERPEVPVEGTIRFNTDLNTLEFYNGVNWRQFTVSGARGRGLFMGVFTAPYRVGDIDYIEMATLGNALDFGNLDTVDFYGGATSNNIRGLCMGGWTHPADAGSNIIQYVTIASTGDAIDFGDLTQAVGYMQAACGSSTRAVRCGGAPNPSPTGAVNVMDYVEIMTTGNAIDFGDLYIGVRGTAGCSSATRGLVFGGTSGASPSNVTRKEIQQFTIASKGNSVRFGDMSQTESYIAATSNSVRGIRMGGNGTPTYTNTIDYVTIASEGNASYFGDLTIATGQSGGTASQTRGFNCGGCTGHPVYINTIDYVTLTTAGNATDFGDSITKRGYNTGCSDSHGGLGGI